MKLLLVDDHALFREGMELVLRHLDPQAEVFHAVNVDEAVELIARQPGLDLVLLDLHMPGLNGLDALLQLRMRAESTPVVVLSGSDDVQTVWRAIDAGAMGYIQKQTDSRTMMAALRVVLLGGVYLPPVCLTEAGRRGVAAATGSSTRERLHQLGISDRQAEIMARVVRGHSNKVVARQLGIGEATVKSHIASVFQTLHVHSRTEAVYVVAQLGLNFQELNR